MAHHDAAVTHGEHGADADHGHGHGHHGPELWVKRIIKNLWLNNVFFAGIALIGVFFIAFNYIAQAGWSALIKRVPESFGYYLPIAFVLTVIIYFTSKHTLFHWTDESLYDPTSPNYDALVASKSWYLAEWFFILRMFAYFILWIGIWYMLRKCSVSEDLNADLKWHDKSIFWSAIFLLVWGVTSSTSAWDWVMSIDVHFFSTMFGWYVFASWFVSGLAAITLITLYLKDAGYLKWVNSNHLHDLGKFVFAFSVFWTYVWFAQFMLIYYSNIPEEVVYFVERLKSDVYSPIFFINIIINFLFPFLALMTREAKRQGIILKVVCIAVLIGHWLDFYLMMTPGIMGQSGGLDYKFFFVELGLAMVFLGVFISAILFGLSKANLVAKNHPMLEESLHHHVY
ncbi:MAG TPA: quinol:cytochrome C oxidoreductase [Cytophagaceae bacterium]